MRLLRRGRLGHRRGLEAAGQKVSLARSASRMVFVSVEGAFAGSLSASQADFARISPVSRF